MTIWKHVVWYRYYLGVAIFSDNFFTIPQHRTRAFTLSSAFLESKIAREEQRQVSAVDDICVFDGEIEDGTKPKKWSVDNRCYVSSGICG